MTNDKNKIIFEKTDKIVKHFSMDSSYLTKRSNYRKKKISVIRGYFDIFSAL